MTQLPFKPSSGGTRGRHHSRFGSHSIRTVASVFLACAAVGAAEPVRATSVAFFSPDSASASNENLSGASATNLVNRSGIGAGEVTLSNIDTTLHVDDVTALNGWRGSASAIPITLIFGFSTPQRIDYIGLWQWDAISQGTGGFTVTFWSGPDGTGSQIGAAYSSVLDTGTGDSIPLSGRAFDVGPRTGVVSIDMTILSIALPTSDHVHLGEFMVASVPVPSGVWMFGAALPLLLGFARRQHRA